MDSGQADSFSTEREQRASPLREQHAQLYEELDAFFAEALGTLSSGYTPDYLAYAAGLIYWVRCIEACQATVLIAENGLSTAAFSTLRTAYECLFVACALWRRPELLEKLEQTHDTERIQQAAEMLKHVDELNLSDTARATLEEVAAEKSTKKKLSAFDTAKAADLLPQYQVVWRGSALAGAHATVRSMDTYCFEQPDGSFIIDLRPSYDRIPFFIGLVTTCLKTGLQRLEELQTESSS